MVFDIELLYHTIPKVMAKLKSLAEIKMITEKRLQRSRKDWSRKLDDALWAYERLSKQDWLREEKGIVTNLNELDEFRNEAYENAKIYKERTKKWHDQGLIRKEFQPGQQVLLFNSRLKLFPGKLKSRWSGPFTVVKVFPYGAVELKGESPTTFKVNGQG
ncbi:uncharacterized protein LOC133032295 [Cannabis sativa]|uniref:uncharacterized protein LOC133032295 n=1 Tax=Cannabis sativa TaxID=3483 RepID=UPI0029C9C4EF|nr:uncharacterized protein LOC133032295 [Cannabis sativa]